MPVASLLVAVSLLPFALKVALVRMTLLGRLQSSPVSESELECLLISANSFTLSASNNICQSRAREEYSEACFTMEHVQQGFKDNENQALTTTSTDDPRIEVTTTKDHFLPK